MNEYTTPLILVCNVSGRKQKLYHRPYIDSLITKHGSIENLLKNYVAKGVKKPEAMSKKTDTSVTLNEPEKVQNVAAKVSIGDIKPSHVSIIGTTIDGDIQTCTVYENYDK